MKNQLNFLGLIKNDKKALIIVVLFQIHFAYSQVNYCGNCGIFKNDNLELYKNISNIEFREYKGSPIFEDLDEDSKLQLLEETQTVTYNDFGKVEEYASNGLFSISYKFTYNEIGEIVGLIENEVIEHKETFNYDKEKNEVKQYIYDYDGVNIDRIIVYKLNRKGQTLNEKEFNGSGGVLREHSFKYDDKGNEIFSIQYGVKATTTCKYDEQGRIISKYTTNNYGKGFTTTFKYNLNGKIIEQIGKSDQTGLSYKIIYEYDNNLMISEKRIDYSNGKERSTEAKKYFYDNRRMWIKEITTRNDILALICMRVINYKN
ncbi:hypothetical protein EQG63_11885 [Flavobacterium amnicola]|uniref:YD repeat-containing protein n=1 Tax=Flavobacterium amnicola TaxID=2506422 RepID=A0A4Q1K186_9FLAO|nr:hypothetical protein [Flavobacterium amnicola]RXR16315.1 hypothetical protein EQG63_11885 [Flavobacterium amnicola]